MTAGSHGRKGKIMYAHQVIDSLNNKKHMQYVNATECEKDHNKIVIDRILKSQCFHFIIPQKIPVLIDFSTINSEPLYLPFDNIFIDLSLNESDQEKDPIVTFVLITKIINKNTTNEYELYGGYNAEKVMGSRRFRLISFKAKYTEYGAIEMIRIFKETIVNGDDGTGFLKMLINIAHRVIMLLNCKNIESEKILAPSALNKKRRLNGKQEIFDYHVLNIIVPANKKRGYQEQSIPLSNNRVHLCRGHFKEYTPEHPLFGQYVGRYWWQPSVRGQNKDGIIMKDYTVTPKEAV